MGKTSLILSLVCKQGKAFNRKFDRVYVFSPSLITMEDDPFELIPDDQKFEEATEENIDSVLEEIKDSGEKVLLILDDVIADIRGKGKGNVEYWICQIQPGRVLYEMEGVSEELARAAFELAATKLPMKTTFVTRTVM